MIDLARTSVFLDFDGTVTLADTGVHVLARLADPGWRALDDDYAAGRIGSRECLVRQWALLAGTAEETLRSVAREVLVDPGFAPLVGMLASAGAEVTVVSDGFGFRAREVCEEVSVALLTNEVDFSTGELRFPHADRCCPCATCGTCKQAPLKDARRRGRLTVLVGDGTSDRKAALLADVLFAKGPLAEWCEATGVAYRPFGCLDDVRRSLLG